jgi:hypothetical protein
MLENPLAFKINTCDGEKIRKKNHINRFNTKGTLDQANTALT